MALSFDKHLIALGEVDKENGIEIYGSLMGYDEEVVYSFKSIRDRVVFTNRRIITINTQGVTGKKKEFFSIFYCMLTAFSVETAGTFDLDCELKLYLSPIGEIQLNFVRGTDIQKLSQLIADHVK